MCLLLYSRPPQCLHQAKPGPCIRLHGAYLVFPSLINHKPRVLVAPREIYPLSQGSSWVATWLPASCHLGVASWVLRKPRVQASEACPKLPPGRGGILHGLPMQIKQGMGYSGDLGERRPGRKTRGETFPSSSLLANK